MNAYIYQAALLCERCGESAQWNFPTLCDNGSDYYPDGPYPDGGGESDSPNHCDHCGLFLENPLTYDGVEYVKEAIEDGSGDAEVLKMWTEFYDYIYV